MHNHQDDHLISLTNCPETSQWVTLTVAQVAVATVDNWLKGALPKYRIRPHRTAANTTSDRIVQTDTN